MLHPYRHRVNHFLSYSLGSILPLYLGVTIQVIFEIVALNDLHIYIYHIVSIIGQKRTPTGM